MKTESPTHTSDALSDANQQKILLVDDSDVILNLLKVTLEKSGYQIEVANSFAKAQIALHQHAYQLLILDYMLARNTTGFDLVRRFREAGLSLPPIIMLSAEKSSAHRAEAKQLGVKAWMKKPFTPITIIQLVDQVLTAEHTGEPLTHIDSNKPTTTEEPENIEHQQANSIEFQKK